MRFASPIYLGLYLAAAVVSTAPAAPLDTGAIEQITGLSGVLDTNEEVFKIIVPRTEFQVFVDGQSLSSFQGLKSRAAFSATTNNYDLVMADFALFQDEVNPAIDAALSNGLAVTALNSRFLFDEPRVYFMHITGRGDLGQLAKGIAAVFAAVQKTRIINPNLAVTFGGLPAPAHNDITGQTIESILGVNGRKKDGMFKVVTGRTTSVLDVKISKAMGVNNRAIFAGTDDNATVDGDLVVTEDELQGVLKTLRKGGIYITAISSRMTDETPRMLFVNFWGNGDIEDLARTLKTALDHEHE